MVGDRFRSTDGSQTFAGTQGDDDAATGDGNDTLNGSGGNDLLAGMTGNDTVNGGAGNDTIRYTVGDGGDVTNGDAGTDTLVVSGTTASDTLSVDFNGTAITQVGGGGSVSGIEAITADLLGGTDTLAYTDTTAAVIVNLLTSSATGFASVAGIENVTGGGGNDSLTGSTAANTLAGGNGTDALIATIDNVRDTFNGEGGSDTANYSAYLTGLTVNLGAAAPIIVTGSGSSAATSDVLVSIENFTGGSGNDTITGSAGAANTLNGGAGRDTLQGAGGGDILIGGTGADTVSTGAVNDNLQSFVRFTAAGEFGNSVTNFDTNGTTTDDVVQFTGALNTAWDDGNSNDNFQFAVGNGAPGAVSASVGQGTNDAEALLLTGTGGEGVGNTSLVNAVAVSAAFNANFTITASNGEDALLVVNDTNGNDFSAWQWVQAGGGETAADELTLIGVFRGNAAATVDNFDFA